LNNTGKIITSYIILVIIFGFSSLFTALILFHPHATPLSNDFIGKYYSLIMLGLFLFTFATPAVIVNKKYRKNKT